MQKVLGKWLGLGAAKVGPSLLSLAGLAPYARLSEAELRNMLDLIEQREVRPGLITDELPNDMHVFLERGSLQVQTLTGYMLQLKAGTQPARYPVPLKPTVASLFAAEPCSFLCIPNGDMPMMAGTAGPTLVRPPLSADEAEALDELHDHFCNEHCDLPSLPDLALKIGKAIDDPNNANDDIARLIQLDPSLTTRLLSVVNSAAFRGVNKISSINQATARLGRKKVRSLVYSCLLKSLFKINSSTLKRRMEQLWQHSVYVAALSFVLGRETPGIDPEQALLAGLIHDIGAVAVIGGINRYPALARRDEVLDYAIDSLRIDVGLQTLKQWGLFNEFEAVVRDAANWQRTGYAVPMNADVVILAQLHARIGSPKQSGLPRIDSIPAFSKLARGELTPRHSLTILEEAEEDVREIRALIATS